MIEKWLAGNGLYMHLSGVDSSVFVYPKGLKSVHNSDPLDYEVESSQPDASLYLHSISASSTKSDDVLLYTGLELVFAFGGPW